MTSRVTPAVLLLVAILSAMLFAGLRSPEAFADDSKFEYKFPCAPADACYVTTLAHVGNAFDFDPQGSAGLGSIRAVSEGTFMGYVTSSTVCTWPGGSGLGKYAVIQDVFGRTMRYAHLSAFGSLQQGARVMQGDAVGTEGNTGFSANCASHLHLEGISTTSYIDGIATSSITAGPTLYTSTNSWVSGVSQPAQAIRGVYTFLGALLNPDNSWEALGWTADLNPPHVGCGSFALCQLFIHYVPNPELGRWGSIMDFKRHPQTFEFENNPNVTFDADAIMAGRWDVNSAYLVQLPFYLSWLLGTPNGRDIGIPLMNQIGTDPALCFLEGCVNYQRFSHGYVWSKSGQGVQSAVFCPDVAGAGSSPGNPGAWPDQVIDLPNDILGTILAFSPGGYGGLPFEFADEARFDVNGDGVIDQPNDILGVILNFLMECFPGGRPPQ